MVEQYWHIYSMTFSSGVNHFYITSFFPWPKRKILYMAVVCDIEKWKQKKRNMIKQAGGLILLYIIWQNKNENENIHLVGQKILKSAAQKKKKGYPLTKQRDWSHNFFSHFHMHSLIYKYSRISVRLYI